MRSDPGGDSRNEKTVTKSGQVGDAWKTPRSKMARQNHAKKAGRVIESGKNTGALTAGQKRSSKQKTGRANNRSERDRAVK